MTTIITRISSEPKSMRLSVQRISATSSESNVKTEREEKRPKTRLQKDIHIQLGRRQFLFEIEEGDVRNGLVGTYTCSFCP